MTYNPYSLEMITPFTFTVFHSEGPLTPSNAISLKDGVTLSGGVRVYTPEQTGGAIACALSAPQALGQPFARWALDRLAAHLSESKGVTIRRSRISELLVAGGLRWRQRETRFGERVDPEFARKRGASRASTRQRPRAA